MTGVVVGLLDSGVAGLAAARVIASRRFMLDPASGDVTELPAAPDGLGHGTVMARLILARAPGAALVDAQIFAGGAVTSAAVAAAGLDWLVGRRVDIVNMSFGLRQDRPVLAQACRRAQQAGVLLIASVPALGPLVFPAAYPGMIRVTGDARCDGAEIAALDGGRADFGASPWPGSVGTAAGDGAPVVAGASVAAARFCGILAAALGGGASVDPVAALSRIAERAAHRGAQGVPVHVA